MKQNINGVDKENFTNNAIAVAAWKATVSKACAADSADLVRVDIISVDDVTSRRLSAWGSSTDASAVSTTIKATHHQHFHVLAAVSVNFDVSYTLEDFETADANVTTSTLKANYQRSVSNQTFVKDFAEEIKKRTVNSDAIIKQILPAQVILSTSFVVVKTTERPTFKPTAQPSSGELNPVLI